MEDTMPEYVGDISIRFPQRPEDVPNELEFNHSLMAQCEIDSLRSEILNLQDQRDLAMKIIERLQGEREEWYRKAHENFKFTLDARDERDKALEKIKRQAARIRKLEGATNHAGGLKKKLKNE